MAWTNGAWTFCIIYLTGHAITATEGSNTTTERTTTTTESGGTITVPVWVIYALVVPIIGVAAVVGLVALCRWILRKRHGSVVPNNEPEKHRIVNDLNTENEADKEILDRFVVSHESKKISKKPKKAVNCLTNNAQTQSVPEETHTGIERLKKAIVSVSEEREKSEQKFQDDAVSENAFNHLKEETSPKVNTQSFRRGGVTATRSESMVNTFKVEKETEDKSNIPRAILAPNRRMRKQKKPKVSALKRNAKLLKSKLNRPTTDDSDETTDSTTEVVSTSTVFTESQEESEIDPSFAQSEEEDFLTDDEDSGVDKFSPRKPKRMKMKDGISIETTAEDMKSVLIHKDVKRSKSTKLKGKEKQMKVQNVALGSHTKDTLKKLPSTTNLNSDYFRDSVQLLENKTSSAFSELNQKTVVQISPDLHVPRQGPIATSSFKSTAEGKADTHTCKNKDKHVNIAKEDSKYLGRQESNDYNYKQFEETVMKRGKLNLNRSVSFNEVDRYNDDLSSRRRKRKYQSLRQARKESVFDVLQKLDIAPKKSILKKSQSLHVKNTVIENSAGNGPYCNARKEESANASRNKACSYTELTDNIEVTELDKDNTCTVLEHNKNLSDKTNNEYVVSRTCSVKLQAIKRNTSLPQRSRTPDPFVEREKHGDKTNKSYAKHNEELNISQELTKQRRNNAYFETEAKGSVAVTSPEMHNEKFHQKSINENLDNSEITSSNLLNISRNSVKDSKITKNSSETFSFDRLSPIVPKQVVHKHALLQEAQEKSSSRKLETNRESANKTHSSDSGSESSVVINSDMITFDTALQAKLRKKLLEHKRLVRPSDDVDLIEIPSENVKTFSSTDTFEIKVKNAFGEVNLSKSEKSENQTDSDMSDTIQDHHKLFKEQDKQSNEIQHASMHASERGLVYPKEHESGRRNSESLQTCTHKTDEHDKPPGLIITQPASKENLFKTVVHKEQNKTGVNDQEDYSSSPSPLLHSKGLRPPSVQNDGKQTTFLHNANPAPFDRFKIPSITANSSNRAEIQDELKRTPLPHRNERQKNLSLSDEQTEDTASTNAFPTAILTVAEMRKTPNYIPDPRQALTDSKEIQRRASMLGTVSTRPVKSFDRPKSADSFSGRQGLKDIKFEMKITEKKNEYVKQANMQHLNTQQKDTERRHVFRLPSTETSTMRSKTPSLEMTRSPKYFLEGNRSKTPTPGPTYIESNTDGSLMKTLVNELKPKHKIIPLSKFQQSSADIIQIESFSRNFPTASKDNGGLKQNNHSRNIYGSSLRNKKAMPRAFEKHDANTKTLLTRREKEENTLGGRVKSRKPSERERPKSAMSLRSAPRPTYLESVHAIPSNSKGSRGMPIRNRSSNLGNGRSFTENAQVPHTGMTKQGEILDMGKRNNMNFQPEKMEQINDSDSEIEQFFANPDVEVLQLNSPDTNNNNVDEGRERDFSVYSRLSKSISFKV